MGTRNFEDQVLYDVNGLAFNLSSIDWGYVSYFYDYHTGGDINDNTTNTHQQPMLPERAIALIAIIFMWCVGVVANILVVYKVLRHRSARRGNHLYFLNVSAADMLYLTVYLPVLSLSYAVDDWKFGNLLCRLENYVMSVNIAVCSLTVLAAGLHQGLSITYPDKTNHFRATRTRVYVLCSVWILSLTVLAPRTFIFNEMPAQHVSGPAILCGRDASVGIRRLDSGLMFMVLYVLPLLVLATCCCMIGRDLWMSRVSQFTLIKATDVRRRRSGAQLSLAVTVVFAIAWLPFHVWQLLEDFGYGHLVAGELADTGSLPLLVSAGTKVCNPVLYWAYSRSQRKPAEKTSTSGVSI